MTKDHILSEIRRTASLNGGKPLGIARFFAETGIKTSDWNGKYWIRWGDALKEAGYQPNQLNAALGDDDLLGNLANLMRELGHFPVMAEFKLKARTDPGFPSFNTFGRFGKKRQLAARLRDYLLKQGQEDLAALCPLIIDGDDELEPVRESSDDVVYGFVYPIKSGRYFKVGKTNSAGRRERELAIQLPERATTVHVIRTDDPSGIEAYWHKRFGAKRKNGEWFELDASDVMAFKRRKFM
jgi:hypothetical protein